MFENVVFRLENRTLFLDCGSIKSAQKLSRLANNSLVSRFKALMDVGILDADYLWIGMNNVTYAHVNIRQQVLYRSRVRLEKSLRR